MDHADRDAAFAFALACVLLLFGAVAWRTLLRSEATALAHDNAALVTELAHLRQISDGASPELLAAALEERIALVAALSAGRTDAARTLSAVQRAVPSGVWLTALHWSGPGLTLTGRTDDPAGAAEVMDGLRLTGCFEEVTLSSVSGPAAARTFDITARSAPTCEPLGLGDADPFRPPTDPQARPDLLRAPLYRWTPDAYDVIALVPGRTATLRDPDGATHEVQVGAAIGHPAAVVSFITDDQVLLSQDAIIDADTRETRSRIIELPLDR